MVSLQVLQEYFVCATKKLKLDAGIARNKVEFHSRSDVAEPTVADILAAIDLHRLHGLSFWDALSCVWPNRQGAVSCSPKICSTVK